MNAEHKTKALICFLSSTVIYCTRKIPVEINKRQKKTNYVFNLCLYICMRLVLLLPWKPFGMFLPGVISWLPVSQPSITVETFDIVTVTCQDEQDYCEKTEWKQKISLHYYIYIYIYTLQSTLSDCISLYRFK